VAVFAVLALAFYIRARNEKGNYIYMALAIFWPCIIMWFLLIMVMQMRLFFNAMRHFQHFEYLRNRRRMTLMGVLTLISTFLLFLYVYQNTITKIVEKTNEDFHLSQEEVQTMWV
jgi:archaellum biogenesis protein FlaJ (TadC family)